MEKPIFLLLMLFVAAFAVPHFAHASPPGFITRWITTTPDEQIIIPINPFYNTYDYTVNWGDGNTDTDINTTADHNYATPGAHIVTITGIFPAIFFFGPFSTPALTDILQWGSNHWQTMNSAFYGCTGLTMLTAEDTPNLSEATDMGDMFGGATNFNSDISNWDVSTITNMSSVFRDATSFNNNGNALSWSAKTSNVTNMSGMFWGASSFNQDISDWDVSSVTSMDLMFDFATSFNKDISDWNVGNVTSMISMFNTASDFNNGDLSNDHTHPLTWGSHFSKVENLQSMFYYDHVFNQDISSWDVSGVTNMGSMFQSTDAFNNGGQPLLWGAKTANVTNMSALFIDDNSFNQDISDWDTSSVETMSGMFWGDTPFDQDISSWAVGNVTDMSEMLTGVTLSKANYEALLAGWSGQTLHPNVTFDAENSQYCSLEATYARIDLINPPNNWTIHDGGRNCPSHTLTYGADANGTIRGVTYQEVNNGDDGTPVTAVADHGYHFIGWTGGYDSMRNPLTDFDVTDDINETAHFAKNSGGSIGIGSISKGCKDPQALNYNEFSVSDQTLCKYAVSSFSRDLKLGSMGDDVKALQAFLNKKGFLVSVSGPGSMGNETIHFGSFTQNALKKFQSSKNVVPVAGYFGPKTRGIVNQMLAQ